MKPVPLEFVGVCKSCGYSLRGLSDSRCPECGRLFDPALPTTYDRPTSDPVSQSGQIVGTWGGDSFRAFFPSHVADRLSRLEQQVRQVTSENARLLEAMQSLVKVLRERGALSPDELLQFGQLTASIESPDVSPETSLASEPDVDEAAFRAIESSDVIVMKNEQARKIP